MNNNRYANLPLIEAICEIRFAEGTLYFVGIFLRKALSRIRMSWELNSLFLWLLLILSPSSISERLNQLPWAIEEVWLYQLAISVPSSSIIICSIFLFSLDILTPIA